MFWSRQNLRLDFCLKNWNLFKEKHSRPLSKRYQEIRNGLADSKNDIWSIYIFLTWGADYHSERMNIYSLKITLFTHLSRCLTLFFVTLLDSIERGVKFLLHEPLQLSNSSTTKRLTKATYNSLQRRERKKEIMLRIAFWKIFVSHHVTDLVFGESTVSGRVSLVERTRLTEVRSPETANQRGN